MNTAPGSIAPADRRVGIVGTGNMGGGMATNLLARGWQVQVHDLDHIRVETLRNRGAVACADAAAAAANVSMRRRCGCQAI